MLSISRRQAYTEIDNFIELLNENNRNKVPKKLRELHNPDNVFKRKKQANYKFNNTTDELSIAQYEESVLKRIISKIKCFLHIN